MPATRIWGAGHNMRLFSMIFALYDQFIPESCSTDVWDNGEVGAMIRLGDGRRFPSRGKDPFVFIRGPWWLSLSTSSPGFG